ncbi:hypothetical protein DFH11DRAFT_225067 [Phellopilus nigrolimitatus]|nr:hypothetical protein DFH11DRAFT_225067 [Phellopilus nigrolimitatus]
MGRRRRRSAKQAPPAVTYANSLFNARNSVLSVPELLSLIFVHVFEAFALSMTTFIFDRNLTTSFNSIPLRLSQVCQRWYVVAKSTPRIWTWIDLKRQNRVLNGEPEMHTGRLHSYLDCWLERSGGLPLSVCARFYDAALFAKLLQHAHRWRNVHFGFTVRNAFPILEKPISTLLASLENLELELGYELEPLDNPEGWTSVINLANLARLSSLHIIGRNPEEALSLRPPSSLKTLKLTHGTFLLLPVRMPSLISLEFDQSTLRSLPEDTVFDRARTLTLRDTPLRPDIFPKLHILLPHLTTLTVLRIENEDYNDDFTYDGLVELPALQSLSVPCQHPLISNLVAPSLAEITWAGSYEDNPLDLRVLIRRSRCQRTLQSFKIEGPIDHEEAVIYVLEEMPSLVKLDVLMDQVSERILFALTVPDKQPSQTVDTVDDNSDLEEIPWHLPPKSYLRPSVLP